MLSACTLWFGGGLVVVWWWFGGGWWLLKEIEFVSLYFYIFLI